MSFHNVREDIDKNLQSFHIKPYDFCLDLVKATFSFHEKSPENAQMKTLYTGHCKSLST